MPDPELWVDEWADEYMRIPRDTGAAEPGKYRTDRTPYAREPMRCLSPAHPCKRVITKVASQLMKTQIALNWIGSLIHMSPSNILTLLPSLGLAKRVSARIAKTISVTPELSQRVTANRSRDSRNTVDTKEFDGGTLYATTAGSASNLAELSARFVYGDEVDRWDVDVDEEGDPIELAETRGSTFGRNANPAIIVAEQVIPAEVGGKWIREIALYDADGDMIAIANCPPTFKPLLNQGSGRTQVVRMNLLVSSSSSVELKIDPSVVLATREYVDRRILEVLPQDKKPGTYTQVTINQRGIVVAGENPTTLAGYASIDSHRYVQFQ